MHADARPLPESLRDALAARLRAAREHPHPQRLRFRLRNCPYREASRETLAAGGRLSLELDDAAAALDPSVKTSLYRIVQEAVAGTPDGVRVGISGTPAEVTLGLRLPGGTAVPPAIQARAEAAGGRVQTTTLRDGATRVRVALPRPS